jgi:hypothetical protein
LLLRRSTSKKCVVGTIENKEKVKAENVEKTALKAKYIRELVFANVDMNNTQL